MDTAIKVTWERFAEGMTISQFVENMAKNQDVWEENYRGFNVDPTNADFFHSLKDDLNVLVLAEDWCSDVMRYFPAFAKLAEIMPNWNVRVFLRDDDTDLADLWLKDGKHRAIPVFTFFDQQMREVACFVEKPAAVYAAEAQARQRFANEHPHLADANVPVGEMSDTTREVYTTYIRQFRNDNKWVWQQWFVDEIREKLEGIKRKRNAA